MALDRERLKKHIFHLKMLVVSRDGLLCWFFFFLFHHKNQPAFRCRSIPYTMPEFYYHTAFVE